MDVYNKISNESVASTILTLLGVKLKDGMREPIEAVCKKGKRDRVLMYNPDAIASWIFEKHRDYFAPLFKEKPMALSMLSSVPPVTPVCFASMYSGLSPEKHGIQSYVKPILKCETVFDVLSKNGKRCAIVSTEGDSISKIFLSRDIDYYIYKTKAECNAKALSLIGEDKHELIVLYNGDYDRNMHIFSPEGKPSLKALRENVLTYQTLCERAKEVWKDKSYAVAFAPDHGCHKTHLFFGTHGIVAPSDMNIMHFWTFSG